MNNWLDKLERKFSRYAIPNLMTYIIILYAAGFVLNLINPTFYSQFLSLDAGKIPVSYTHLTLPTKPIV